MAEYASCFPVERDVNGNLLDEARCETCNGNAPALSVPNSSGARYVSIQYNTLIHPAVSLTFNLKKLTKT